MPERLAGVERVPEPRDQLVGVRPGPDDADHLAEVAADQVGNLAERLARGGIGERDPELVVHEIDAERSVGDESLELRRRLAPRPGEVERATHPRHQLARREGLHQIVVGAGLKPFDPGLLARAGGEQDDR